MVEEGEGEDKVTNDKKWMYWYKRELVSLNQKRRFQSLKKTGSDFSRQLAKEAEDGRRVSPLIKGRFWSVTVGREVQAHEKEWCLKWKSSGRGHKSGKQITEELCRRQSLRKFGARWRHNRIGRPKKHWKYALTFWWIQTKSGLFCSSSSSLSNHHMDVSECYM